MLIERPDDRSRLIVRNSLRGGIVGLEIGLVATALTHYLYYNPALFLFAMLVPGVFAASLIALIGLLVQRRNRSLNVVEAELEKGLAMVERGMIDAEDYQRIKGQVLEAYRPGRRDPRSVLRWAFTGGVAAATLPLMLMAAHAIRIGLGAYGIVAIVGAVIVGGGLAAAGSAGVWIVQERSQHQLPQPTTERPILGR
jgi:hypothetical protein